MEKRELGAQPSLSSSLPPDSFLLSCSGPYETSQYREGAQANKQMSWSVCQCVCVCAHRSTEIEEYTHVCVGGRIIMEKSRAVTFFIKTLADDQRRRSYCWKTHSPFPVHTGKHTQSSTFLHPPPHSCFQTSAESCVPLSHLLSKVTIKDAECVHVRGCTSVCGRFRKTF